MLEVCEFSLRDKPVVLVIEEIAPGSMIGGERIGPNELKDLNRGRKFLEEVAHRHQVPVYRTVSDAVREAIKLAKQRAG